MEKKITIQELAAADRTSEGPYVRQLGDEEKATLAESIADLSQQEEDKAQAKKDALAMFGAEIKEIKLHRKDLMKYKRTGYADAHGSCSPSTSWTSALATSTMSTANSCRAVA